MSSDTWDEKGRKSEEMGRESDEKGREGTRRDEKVTRWDEKVTRWDEKVTGWGRKKRRLITVSCYIYECLFYILIQFVLKIFFNAIIKIINFR